ncbi:MAG: hypothetical protein JNK87_35250 [Bryobacterales bacterium]|nr:hypothetical protein [Bryobacterales bacterium]
MAIVLAAFTHVLIERNPELAYDTFARHPLPLAGKNLDRLHALSTRLGRATPSTTAVTERPLPDPLAAMRRAMTAMLTGPASRLENHELIITGTHDTYTLRIADGGMYRHSDNRPIHIALNMQDQEFAPFQHMIDAMDLQHPFQPNYVRLALCAKVLENDVANVDIIRAED